VNLARQQREDLYFCAIIDDLVNSETNHEIPVDKKYIEFCLRDNVLYKLGTYEYERLCRLCIPISLRKKLLTELHENVASHLGFVKTYHLCRTRFFWLLMYKHFRRFIQGCQLCQFHNRGHFPNPGPSQPVPPPKKPFERVGIDFQGPFPASHRYRNCYVLVIVDHCTRYLEAWPVKAADSRCAIEILETNLLYRHSVPIEILVD